MCGPTTQGLSYATSKSVRPEMMTAFSAQARSRPHGPVRFLEGGHHSSHPIDPPRRLQRDELCANICVRDGQFRHWRPLLHIHLVSETGEQVSNSLGRRMDAERPNRTIRNKDAIRFDYDFRESSLQLLRVSPVRRRAPPVENPCLSQGEDADANGCNTPRSCYCFP
jgi:hypothetical protein